MIWIAKAARIVIFIDGEVLNNGRNRRGGLRDSLEGHQQVVQPVGYSSGELVAIK